MQTFLYILLALAFVLSYLVIGIAFTLFRAFTSKNADFWIFLWPIFAPIFLVKFVIKTFKFSLKALIISIKEI